MKSIVQMCLVASMGIFLVLICAQPGLAKKGDMKAFQRQYPQAGGSRIDSCLLCHPAGNYRLNTYGKDYTISRKNFATLEAKDSDQDGFDNKAEIKALTFPGSPQDKPKFASVVVPATH